MLKEDNADSSAKRIDVYKWLGKCTLDVIGLAGFDYDFASLSNPDNELANAFAKMFSTSTVGPTPEWRCSRLNEGDPQSITPFVVLQSILPLLSKIVSLISPLIASCPLDDHHAGSSPRNAAGP